MGRRGFSSRPICVRRPLARQGDAYFKRLRQALAVCVIPNRTPGTTETSFPSQSPTVTKNTEGNTAIMPPASAQGTALVPSQSLMPLRQPLSSPARSRAESPWMYQPTFSRPRASSRSSSSGRPTRAASSSDSSPLPKKSP